MAETKDSTRIVSVRYTVNVSISVPVDEDDVAADYLVGSELRRLERNVIQALKKLDGDIDAECMDAECLDVDGLVVPS